MNPKATPFVPKKRPAPTTDLFGGPVLTRIIISPHSTYDWCDWLIDAPAIAACFDCYLHYQCTRHTITRYNPRDYTWATKPIVPADIFRKILSYIPHSQLVPLRLVSKYWLRVMSTGSGLAVDDTNLYKLYRDKYIRLLQTSGVYPLELADMWVQQCRAQPVSANWKPMYGLCQMVQAIIRV